MKKLSPEARSTILNAIEVHILMGAASRGQAEEFYAAEAAASQPNRPAVSLARQTVEVECAIHTSVLSIIGLGLIGLEALGFDVADLLPPQGDFPTEEELRSKSH